MLLKVEKLNKSYNKKKDTEIKIFKNLDFCIEKDRVVVIFGPSGIGKTTFLNMIGTVDRPDSG